jgi:hypothetical protein
VLNIWLPIDQALEKYKQYRHLITASNYITPFNTVSEKDVKNYFDTDAEIEICSQTPSLGEIWATHPSYKYASNSNLFFGRNIIFCKVSNEANVEIELENLKKMNQKLSVPTPIQIIKHKNDVRELKEMKPTCKIAAMLVEEFINSISIGRALIEVNIDIEVLRKEVLKILTKMHSFCTHRDLKQSHIRVRLDPEECKNLVIGLRSANEITLEGVSVIDVETVKMNSDLSVHDVKSSIENDLNQFIISLTGYLSTLECQSEQLNEILPMPINNRLERFGILLETISEKYKIFTPSLVIKQSITFDYLLKFIQEKMN